MRKTYRKRLLFENSTNYIENKKFKNKNIMKNFVKYFPVFKIDVISTSTVKFPASISGMIGLFLDCNSNCLG